MSLERFRSQRLVVLPPRATAYEAGRAMADNHVGSVLVAEAHEVLGVVTDRDLALEVVARDLDPRGTSLRDVMSDEVVVCPIDAPLGEALERMRDHGVRRLPLVEAGRPVGLLTLDDLLVEGVADAAAVRDVVAAQLTVGTRLKPEGGARPTQPARPRVEALRRHREARHEARADGTHGRLLHAIARHTGIEGRARLERLAELVLGRLCERLLPDEARHFIAQLPSKMHASLERRATGPDRHVTLDTLAGEVARELACDASTARDVVFAVCDAVAEGVSPGEIDAVRGQLPGGMKDLFPPAYRRAG